MSEFQFETPTAQDWQSVVQLFADEYGTEPEAELARLQNSLKPEDDARALVAKIDNVVLGFQSYMPWEVCQAGTTTRCFQSGNSIVAPAARGKGLFAQLLTADAGLSPETPLFGFPVIASFQAFVRDGWTAPFRLESYVKPVLSRKSRDGTAQPPIPTSVNTRQVPDGYVGFLCQEPPMRRQLRLSGEAAQTWLWQTDDQSMIFNYKLRKAQLKGLSLGTLVQLGGVSTLSDSRATLAEGVRSFLTMVGQQYGSCLVEFAVNSLSDQWPRVLDDLGFRWRRKAGCNFVVRNFGPEPVPWNRWWVFRGDLDSW